MTKLTDLTVSVVLRYMNENEKAQEIKNKCKVLTHHPPKSMYNWFKELSEYLEKQDQTEIKSDQYGQGEYIQNFEAEIAKLFGQEKAVFMPSGTMAQQIALRIWSDKTRNRKVVMHPTSHLEVAEHYAYEYLHSLQRIQLGIPDFTANRLLTFDDFNKLQEYPGSVLLELPQRQLGGQLPDWGELLKITNWAKSHKVKLHLDGARIWEVQPFYTKSFQEIGELFDSIYLSFYKGLNGIAGSMLLGSKAFIEESRIWLRRMGGNLPSIFPQYVAAKWGMEYNLPKMEKYWNIAKQLAAALNEMDIFETNPTIPQTNMFHLFIRGDEERIKQVHLEQAEDTGTWLINGTTPSVIPSYQRTEIVIASSALDLDIDEIIMQFQKLCERIQNTG